MPKKTGKQPPQRKHGQTSSVKAEPIVKSEPPQLAYLGFPFIERPADQCHLGSLKNNHDQCITDIKRAHTHEDSFVAKVEFSLPIKAEHSIVYFCAMMGRFKINNWPQHQRLLLTFLHQYLEQYPTKENHKTVMLAAHFFPALAKHIEYLVMTSYLANNHVSEANYQALIPLIQHAERAKTSPIVTLIAPAITSQSKFNIGYQAQGATLLELPSMEGLVNFELMNEYGRRVFTAKFMEQMSISGHIIAALAQPYFNTAAKRKWLQICQSKVSIPASALESPLLTSPQERQPSSSSSTNNPVQTTTVNVR